QHSLHMCILQLQVNGLLNVRHSLAVLMWLFWMKSINLILKASDNTPTFKFCREQFSLLTALRDVCRFADRKSTRLNSSHVKISYAVFCLKKKNTKRHA